MSGFPALVLYNNRSEANSRVVASAIEEGLLPLAAFPTLFMGGNFAMALSHFSQVYVYQSAFQGYIRIHCVCPSAEKELCCVL